MKTAISSTMLYRPVGLAELALIFDSEMKGFPPRLSQQPIFYPVLNRNYAEEIAGKWNISDDQSGHAGDVTEFELDDYAKQFAAQTVGGDAHQELWIPAEKLTEFNSHIVGHIQTVNAFFGEKFVGYVPEEFGLKGKNAIEQFLCLAETLDYSGMDFICETTANAKTMYLNYPFWMSRDFEKAGVSPQKKQRVLAAIKKLWQERKPSILLCDCQN
jgi:hypothetical protein